VPCAAKMQKNVIECC